MLRGVPRKKAEGERHEINICFLSGLQGRIPRSINGWSLISVQSALRGSFIQPWFFSCGFYLVSKVMGTEISCYNLSPLIRDALLCVMLSVLSTTILAFFFNSINTRQEKNYCVIRYYNMKWRGRLRADNKEGSYCKISRDIAALSYLKQVWTTSWNWYCGEIAKISCLETTELFKSRCRGQSIYSAPVFYIPTISTVAHKITL